ncbi:hypothetical protein ACFHWD_04230 [Clostridium sp. MT-14]|uniref:hypothetical protein n=1 Tax=Clostridium sp. MT-14 TaxID=3348360 RepID=UPI0035F3BF6F
MSNIEVNETTTYFTFHDKSIEAIEGNIFSNSEYEEITIDIQGTASSFEVIFEGKVDSNSEWSSIMFANLTDLSLNTKATELNSKWNNNINGLFYLRVRITNITDGYLTIIGRLKK